MNSICSRENNTDTAHSRNVQTSCTIARIPCYFQFEINVYIVALDCAVYIYVLMLIRTLFVFFFLFFFWLQLKQLDEVKKIDAYVRVRACVRVQCSIGNFHCERECVDILIEESAKQKETNLILSLSVTLYKI